MWTAQSEEMPDVDGLRFVVEHGSRPSTFEEVVHGWQCDMASNHHNPPPPRAASVGGGWCSIGCGRC